MSEMVWSLSRGSSGPRPKISSRISRDNRSRSAKLRGITSLLTELRMRTRTSSRAESPVERPSFSRSRRSRILRCRSAFTCWYSLCSKVCRLAILTQCYTVLNLHRLHYTVLNLYRFEQGPVGAFHIGVVAGQFLRQSGKASGNLGVTLFHHRCAPINGGGDREVLI